LESSQDDVSDDDPIRSATGCVSLGRGTCPTKRTRKRQDSVALTFLEPEIVAIKLRPIPPPLATETFDISSAPRGQT